MNDITEATPSSQYVPGGPSDVPLPANYDKSPKPEHLDSPSAIRNRPQSEKSPMINH